MNTTPTTPTTANNLMITLEADIAGAVSYWRLSGTLSLEKLRARWETAGLPPALLPKPVGDQVAFGRAVAEQQTSRDAAGKRRFVTTLRARGAWAIVEETCAQDRTLTYRTLATCEFKSDRSTTTKGEADEATYDAICEQIHSAYQRQRGLLDANDISSWLVKLAYAKNAVSLRDSGGIYFLPRSAVDFWRAVSSAIEACSAHKIFRIPAMRNDEAVRSVLDAITDEAARAATQIEEELCSTDEQLGKRALQTRQKECKTLLEKIGEYEQLLGEAMPKISERIAHLQASLVAAALTAERDD